MSENVVDKKAIKEQLETEAAELATKQTQLAEIEKELEKNETFKHYMEFKNKFNSDDAMFRETVKNEMAKHGISKLKGDWGSITLVNKETYKVSDEEQVPDEYKHEKTIVEIDTKQAKEDYILTGILPAGIEIKKSQYVMVKGAK